MRKIFLVTVSILIAMSTPSMAFELHGYKDFKFGDTLETLKQKGLVKQNKKCKKNFECTIRYSNETVFGYETNKVYTYGENGTVEQLLVTWYGSFESIPPRIMLRSITEALGEPRSYTTGSRWLTEHVWFSENGTSISMVFTKSKNFIPFVHKGPVIKFNNSRLTEELADIFRSIEQRDDERIQKEEAKKSDF